MRPVFYSRIHDKADMNWTRITAVLCAAPLSFPAVAQSWKPERPVEVIVGTSPGGGQDMAARTVERILSSRSLLGVADRKSVV